MLDKASVVTLISYLFRFKVVIEMLKPDKLDPATSLKGLDYIDVPGLSKRDYKLHFFCHKDQASYSARVSNQNSNNNKNYYNC